MNKTEFITKLKTRVLTNGELIEFIRENAILQREEYDNGNILFSYKLLDIPVNSFGSTEEQAYNSLVAHFFRLQDEKYKKDLPN